MDQNPPVFFNSFDPFDNPAPPKPAMSSAIPTSNNPNPSVNTSVPSASPTNNPYFFPSPLDSPSINPYPLPSRVFSPPISSQSSSLAPTPAPTAISPPPSSFSQSSSSSSYNNNLMNPSSVPKTTAPLGSPSLSSQGGYPQLSSAQSQQSPPQHQQQQQQQQQQQPPVQSPPAYHQQGSFSNNPYMQPQVPSPTPYQQPTQPPVQQQLNQSQPISPPAPSQPPSQPALVSTPSTSISQSQVDPLAHVSIPRSSSITSTSNDQHKQLALFEQITGTLQIVMNRLDGIDNRISALEIATKEVLNNQRTISTQQKKLQDAVDTTKLTPAPPPPVHYEEPRRTPVYQPAPMPVSSITPGPIGMPPPQPHSHMPALVPVTHISNRGERVDQGYKGGSSHSSNTYDADLELAKKLQAEFDAQPSSNSTSANSNSNANSSSTYSAPSYSSTKSFSSAASTPAKSGQQECPICQARVALADLEAHVEQHFEDQEAAKGPLKPGEKAISKDQAKAGFFAKLFGPKPEDEKKPNTDASSGSSATSSTSTPAAPYTHTAAPTPAPASAAAASAYNQRVQYYPTMTAPAGQQMYRPGMPYYPYPMQPGMPGVRPGSQPGQQYLYYPNLEQNPQ